MSFSFTIRYQVFRFSNSLVLGVREALETRLLGFVNTFRLVKVKMRICKVSVESSFQYLLPQWLVYSRPLPSGENGEKPWGEVTAVHSTIYYLNFHTSEMVFFNVSPLLPKKFW